MDTLTETNAVKQDIRSRLLYLRQWPDFSSEYDGSRVGDLARICALLSRKPTVGFLVYRSVDLPSYEVEPMLEQLFAAQCIGLFQVGASVSPLEEDLAQASGAVSEAGAVSLAQEEIPVEPESTNKAALTSGTPVQSFLKKLWGKLLTHKQ
ncbi:hypothetical protein E9531_05650 [Lampropedia puyangensis]|uniref:Uncharacterized protein n=1 Tax=Lampropedia puyangensis TaxID=1330072 RepID=A0A4S8FCU2_9BURK|nr:hypothetical protein [Lampropedia puyangensis]THU03672.1 hypothetical protein E9531_05650 [Lampropedia puyangensis]